MKYQVEDEMPVATAQKIDVVEFTDGDMGFKFYKQPNTQAPYSNIAVIKVGREEFIRLIEEQYKRLQNPLLHKSQELA